MTQVQVSAALGKPQPYVSKCESGERRLDIIEVAEFLEVYKLSLGEFAERL